MLAGLVGYAWPDVCHGVANQMGNELKRSGNGFLICELTIVLNFVIGPCNGSAWFHSVLGGMLNYIASGTWQCPLFQAIYEWIAEDMYDFSPARFGMEDHMEFIWSNTCGAKVFFAKGNRV